MQRRGSSADTQGRGLSSDFLLIVHQKKARDGGCMSSPCLVLAHKCESLDLKTEMQNRLFVMNIKQYHDIEKKFTILVIYISLEFWQGCNSTV